MLTMEQMTLCDVKGVACINKPHHLELQFPSARISTSFSSLLWFHFAVLFTLNTVLVVVIHGAILSKGHCEPSFTLLFPHLL